MNTPITVLCVDDSAAISAALSLLVDDERDMKTVGSVEQTADILPAIRKHRPAIAVIDLTMDGECPLAVVQRAAAEFPETKAIIFSGYDDEPTIRKAMDAGAAGFVSKRVGLEGMIAAIRSVAGGTPVVRAL